MNWDLAIRQNCEALSRVLITLFAMAGMMSGGRIVETLPRRVQLKILSLLRPAESATRRLIVMLADGISVALKPVRSTAKPKTRIPDWKRTGPVRSPNVIRAEAEAKASALADAARERIPAFPLFDTRQRFLLEQPRRIAQHCPRIIDFASWEPCVTPPAEPMSEPEEPLDANRLCKRLLSMQHALKDLPAQAQRLARMKARRAKTRLQAMTPIRGGWPPGHRKQRIHAVDQILSDCHALALWRHEPPDILRQRLQGTRYRF